MYSGDYQQQQQQDHQEPCGGQEFDEMAARVQADLERQQREAKEYEERMRALQLYVHKYGARIDFEHKSKDSPNVERANLGTNVPSWYYHDGRGNKIFVQDMNFENALALSKGGQGMSVNQAHGHDQGQVVVVVPRAKRNPAWHAEYLRRCEEYEAAKKRVSSPQAARVAIPDGSRLASNGLPSANRSLAYDSLGRKKGGGSLWDARQQQARILGSKNAQQQQRRPNTARLALTNNNNNSGYNSNNYNNSNNDVLAAVMVDQQQQQQQLTYGGQQQQQSQPQQEQQQQQGLLAAPPSASSAANAAAYGEQGGTTGDASAALQEEARRLLAQLNHQ